MLLLISHFSKNKGTTDFLIDFLENEKKEFYLLKHPFGFTDLDFSELYLYSDGKKTLISKHRKLKSELLNLVKNTLLSIYISFKLGRKVKTYVAFGSFNCFPFLITNVFFGRKGIFYGVDYSKKRFPNKFLNLIYYNLETFACKYSTITVSCNERQETVRVKNHRLNKTASLILSTGITEVDAEDKNKYKNLCLIYIGAITPQHGIIDFIDFFYIKNDFSLPIKIFGSGSHEADLKLKISEAKNQKKITYFGYKKQSEIAKFISNIDSRLFGIAPYSDEVTDHVYYGDSIKIKEYLSFNIPYIVSDIAYVQDNLKQFGIVYYSPETLYPNLEDRLNNFILDVVKKNEVMEEFKWNRIFKKLLDLI